MAQVDYNSLNVPKLPPAWPKGLLIFVLVVTLIIGAGAFFLNSLNQQEEKRLENLEQEFQSLRASFPVEQEKEIAAFEKRLANLTNLLTNHSYFSKVLILLEKVTDPNVYYTDLSYASETNMLTLNGVAKNQQVLSEAVNGLVNDSQEIKAVVLKNVKTNNDQTVTFNLDLILQPQVIKY